MPWLLLFLACTGGPPQNQAIPDPHQGPPRAEDAPSGDRGPGCNQVVSAEGANAIFAAGRGLQGVDADCTFEDVHVRGSTVEIAFEAGDTKVPATMHVAACLSGALPADAVAIGPWALEIPPASASRCPKGFAALKAAMEAGSFPSPTEAR